MRKLAERADPALGAPGVLTAGAGPEPGTPPAVRDALGVLRFRYDMSKELGVDDSGG